MEKFNFVVDVMNNGPMERMESFVHEEFLFFKQYFHANSIATMMLNPLSLITVLNFFIVTVMLLLRTTGIRM